MELAGLFVTAFMVALSGALMPGPLLAVTIDESARRGACAGPLLILGHAVLEGALVAGVAFGLASFLKNPAVISVIAFAGGAILLWMGADMIRAAPGLSLRAGTAPRRRLHPVAAGVVVSLSNPYWTIWWATIGMSYLVISLKLGLAGVLVFFAGHILADLAWYGLVSTGVARGRRLMTDRLYRGIIAVCGVVLLAFGLWFVHTGAATLAGGSGAVRPAAGIGADEAQVD
ncbi:MAG: LysE family transporter [Lentisphaerae bacterium]|nr:LysE family transporter [Lentisphaerota bacterium]